MIYDWKVYKHALLPTTPPHKQPNLDALSKKRIWDEKQVFIVRYTTDFDTKIKTEWWYCIKDELFDLTQVNSKRRYEINRGLKNIDVRRIKTKDYAKELVEITEKAYADYPKKYRPNIDRDQLMRKYNGDAISSSIDYWGVFSKQTSAIIGFAVCILNEGYVNLSMVKIDPLQLKTGANAALVYTLILEYINSGKYKYICDGERNLLHETNYQEYLIKYFGFRKAYCKLHVLYKPILKIAIVILFPFQNFIARFSNIPIFSSLTYLLALESIRRSFKS